MIVGAPLGLSVTTSVLRSSPAAFLALNSTFVVPAAVGVPPMVAPLSDKPSGSGAASYVIGVAPVASMV